MKAIERAVSHFEDQDVRVTIVDEWKDEHGNPLKIYSKPLTLAETSKLYKMSQQDDLKMMAMVLVYKALDESGEKIFDLEDKNTLLNRVEQEVLVRVATAMMGQEPQEKVKKKLIEDSNLYVQFAIAEKLGKTHAELQQITIHEYQTWIAYFEISEEKEVANSKIKYEIIAVNKTAMAFKAVKMGLSGIATAGKAGLFAIKALGAAAVAAAASIALITKKSFDYIDTLGKTASRTGIATETLQAFQLAAIESGTTVEQTQKGLEKFARSIGDAGRGLKTQVDIFSDLGVTLKNTDGSLKSFETILEGVAEGLGELGSEAERATALANLFGRAGIQFSEIFRDGAEGLEEFTRRADDLGIILDDKTIRGVEQFNDTMSVVKLQVGAVVNNITAAFVPALQFLAENLRDVIKDSKNTAEGFDTMGQLIAVSILEGVKTALISMHTFFTNVKAMFIDFASSGAGRFMFGDILSDADKTLIKIKQFEDRIDEIRKNGFAIGGDIIPPGMPAAMDELIRLGDIVQRLKATIADPIDTEGGFVATIDHLIALVKAGSPEVEKLFETFDSGLTNLLEPVAAFEKSLGAEGLAKTLETTAVSSMKKFEDSIVDSLKAGKLSFKNFADYVVEQLLRIAIQQMILKPITGKFESFFKGFGNIFSADGGGYTGSGIRAGGVDGKGGFPAILHPNETVVDHTKGQGMTAAPTVNFNISTVDAAGFDQLLASRKGLITSIINNAMNNQGKMGVV